jgi:hypothetical protein
LRTRRGDVEGVESFGNGGGGRRRGPDGLKSFEDGRLRDGEGWDGDRERLRYRREGWVRTGTGGRGEDRDGKTNSIVFSCTMKHDSVLGLHDEVAIFIT